MVNTRKLVFKLPARSGVSNSSQTIGMFLTVIQLLDSMQLFGQALIVATVRGT
jgi:hypothetical protein